MVLVLQQQRWSRRLQTTIVDMLCTFCFCCFFCFRFGRVHAIIINHLAIRIFKKGVQTQEPLRGEADVLTLH